MVHLGQGWGEGKGEFYYLVVRAFTYNGVERVSSTYCDNFLIDKNCSNRKCGRYNFINPIMKLKTERDTDLTRAIT